MQQSHHHTPGQTTDRTRITPVVQTIFSWIVETDRKFRMTQNHIDSFSNRF